MTTHSPEYLRTQLRRRDVVFRAIRAFFHSEGFLEVDAPVLVPGTGCEPHIDPLEVNVSFKPEGPVQARYLQTSPELYLKRLLARVSDPLFSMGHVFRNGESTPKHAPEFTLLEWYRPKGDLKDLISDCERLIDNIIGECQRQGLTPNPQNEALLLRRPFQVATMQALWLQYAGLDLQAVLQEVEELGEEAMVRAVRNAGFHLRPNADFDDAFFQVMFTAVEPAVGKERPTVISHWPKQMAVLSRLDPENKLFALRFELYAGGFELANAFDELVDSKEQKARFKADNRKREALGKRPLNLDAAFLKDLDQMPPCSGIAFGVDRLIQLIFGLEHIAEARGLGADA